MRVSHRSVTYSFIRANRLTSERANESKDKHIHIHTLALGNGRENVCDCTTKQKNRRFTTFLVQLDSIKHKDMHTHTRNHMPVEIEYISTVEFVESTDNKNKFSMIFSLPTK